MGGLLFERKEPIPRFYRRRIARIIPAHLAFLSIVSIVYVTFELPFSFREFVAALFFINNYVLPEGGPGHAVLPFGHIWSLSVEEHSYVALSLIAIISRKRLISSVSGVGALYVASACFALYYQWINPPKLAYTQWLQTEVAAYGLLATALWVASGRPFPQKIGSNLVSPALLLVGVALHWWSIPLVVQRLLGVACFAAAICVLSVNKGWLAASLSWAPLRQLGLWSFSVYLWQQPFYLWVHSDTRVSPMLGLALALICGFLSYYFIERPARIYLNTHWGVVGAQSIEPVAKAGAAR